MLSRTVLCAAMVLTMTTPLLAAKAMSDKERFDRKLSTYATTMRRRYAKMLCPTRTKSGPA